jgi:hypothetical protein
MGAPDACKTLFLSMLAQVWDAQGLLVGMLAVDEEPEDLAQRFIQRTPMSEGDTAYFQRVHCEDREPKILDRMRRQVDRIEIVFYGPEWTIESAGADLAMLCKNKGKRGALMVDSIQTVECDAMRREKKEVSVRERITENVRAVRYVASTHRLILLATSEMNRSAYKTIGKVDQNDMAAAKESGAIEYSARVMIALRVYPDEENCIEVKVVKNKHGASSPAVDPFYLALERARQLLWEREAPEGVKKLTLVEQCVEAIACRPTGLTTEAVRKAVKSGIGPVMAALQSAQAAKLIRRKSERSPWTLCDSEDEPTGEYESNELDTGEYESNELDPDKDFP